MSAATKAQVIAKTIDASSMSNADLIKLFQKATAQESTPDVRVVLGGIVRALIERGLINPAVLVAA